jgi:hypothetical protein
VNTFGFGYELDSKLLEDIAIMGNSGSYAFIPDGSFVGTIFVNAITTILTTIATNVEVRMMLIVSNKTSVYRVVLGLRSWSTYRTFGLYTLVFDKC